MPSKSDKREKLIAAGQRLFHRNGIANSTLADLAEASGVPLGNIYYYFKNKDALISAVAAHQDTIVQHLLETIEDIADPYDRLQSFVDNFATLRDERAAYGCPLGTLCQESLRTNSAATPDTLVAFETVITWLERQFLQLGFSKKRSQQSAVHVLSAIQGASVVAHAFNDPEVVQSEIAELREWLKCLISKTGTDRVLSH